MDSALWCACNLLLTCVIVRSTPNRYLANMNNKELTTSGASAIGAAEFIAAGELTQDIGLALSYASELGELTRDQIRRHMEVQLKSLSLVGTEPLPFLVAQHLVQQSMIAVDGMVKFNELGLQELDQMFAAHNDLWQAFGESLASARASAD